MALTVGVLCSLPGILRDLELRTHPPPDQIRCPAPREPRQPSGTMSPASTCFSLLSLLFTTAFANSPGVSSDQRGGGCQPLTCRLLGQDCRPGFCVPTCSLFLGPLSSREPVTGRQRPALMLTAHCPLCPVRTSRDLPLWQAQRLCYYNTLV